MSKKQHIQKIIEEYKDNIEKLTRSGVYRSSDEHDACGVGMVANINGKPNRQVVEYALTALKAIWHRGAVDADGKTGDGAGIRLDIPQDFLRTHVEDTGHIPKPDDRIGLGMVFLPRNDFAAQETCRTIMETELIKSGFQIFGWRQVPINHRVLGEKANFTRPEIEQIMLLVKPGKDLSGIERELYVVRRRIEKSIEKQNINDFYICSLSCYSVIYKGLFLSQDIDAFYLDLKDKNFISRFAIYHQRYSTNTFPSWHLAQPFRILAHNGEINTLEGNKNWMNIYEGGLMHDAFKNTMNDILPIIPLGSSDSAALDSVFELFSQSNYSLPLVKSILIPEAWRFKKDLKEEHKQFYAFCNSLMTPWDGPAAICCAFDDWLVCGMDRSGLRPLRYSILKDGFFIAGSESGMVPVDDARILKRDNLDPGCIVAVNLKEGRFYQHEELLDTMFENNKKNVSNYYHSVINLEKQFKNIVEKSTLSHEKRLAYQKTYCITHEDLEMVLRPMLVLAKESIGSMGDDTPIAVLSKNYRSLHHFFRQNFSQVTNPPLDPLRESNVMSLATRLRSSPNILSYQQDTDPLFLETPVLTNGEFQFLLKYLKKSIFIDCLFDPQAGKYALRDAIFSIQEKVREATKEYQHIVLTDHNQTEKLAPIPMILATAAAHRSLVDHSLRHKVTINVRSGECLDSHYFAVLLGIGATTINPYLAQEAIYNMVERKGFSDLKFEEALANYKNAINQGLLKIMSKMGISILSSYRAACNFEAIGLSRAMVNEFFPGMPARISGIGLYGIGQQVKKAHQSAWSTSNALDIGGFYTLRLYKGEQHVWSPDVIRHLQDATKNNSYKSYKLYSNLLCYRKDPIHLRDLLDFKGSKNKCISVDDVEPIVGIRQRFLTPGMSLGALSKEAHGALNIAMNRIGSKSVSGEGGEDPVRYKPLANGDNANSFVKQVASGRFGVTAEYLNQCKEIEIKIAQGAKPGEGGQLPGFKVSVEIAKLRHSTPGVMLISPPPHHDIYSIEDLAQLIYDLKQINPIARVCVKLTSRSGIGTVAAGVAKAKADIISVSGYNGGTGASPLTSIKFAGIPWEMGLSETHQVLAVNRLRDQVTLRTDGGLMTGRDIVIAAMLGAEEFGIGTASLVSMGCIMVRQCHSNTCPVGVCTQDEKLRGFFKGVPDNVVHLMTFIAREVQEILAELGLKALEDVIGRSDLLKQVSRGNSALDDLDMNPILSQVTIDDSFSFSNRQTRNEVPDTLDAKILEDIAPFFKDSSKPICVEYPVMNTYRTIGARVASHVFRTIKHQLPDHQLTIKLKGSAGQSLGAFCVNGMSIHLQGDANDYVGKGLSGAHIFITPSSLATFNWSESTIIGNTVLFGATSGSLYAAGRAGERFCVRNSGALAIVEGCGANGCEYMTGGQVVVLGDVGDNFAAGMTGGMAYVFDKNDSLLRRCNQESVTLNRLENPYYIDRLQVLIKDYLSKTGSKKARSILENWEESLRAFWHIIPKELLDKLSVPLHSVENRKASL